MLDYIVQQAFNFLILGSMYSITAVGFTLYFGTVNLINFAHGDLCTLGAFLLLLALAVLGHGSVESLNSADFACAALIAISVTVIIGLLSERLLFRRVRNRPPLEGLIISIAFSMLIREAILHLYPNGGNPQPFPNPFGTAAIHLGDIRVEYVQLLILGLCGGLTVMFYWLVQRTNLGRIMRGISQDADAAIMLGLPVNRTITWVFAIGACFAVVAGIMNGALYGSVKFDMGFSLGVKGFVGAVIGGLDNPSGAFVGGMLLAFLETAAIGFLPSGSAYRDIIAFGMLLTILFIRPTGLLGDKRDA